MKNYTQLTGVEREQVYLLMQKGQSVKEIAKRLNRHKSTIYREKNRNTDRELGYLPDRAQEKARKRKARSANKLKNNPELKAYVITKLKEGWSPAMISGRAKYEGLPVVVSMECIYQFIYSIEGIKLRLYKYLRMARVKRGKMRGRKPRNIIPDRVSIHERPAEVATRESFGHFEGDTIFHNGSLSQNVAVVQERDSRYILAVKNESKNAADVMVGIFNKLMQLPPGARKTITFDNGVEFARHGLLGMVGIKTYFCDAYASWQKGGVENANRMIRWVLDKKTPLRDISDEELQRAIDRINNMPRKSLGFRTATEAFHKGIVALQT